VTHDTIVALAGLGVAGEVIATLGLLAAAAAVFGQPRPLATLRALLWGYELWRRSSSRRSRPVEASSSPRSPTSCRESSVGQRRHRPAALADLSIAMMIESRAADLVAAAFVSTLPEGCRISRSVRPACLSGAVRVSRSAMVL
jgi:hypothetical protein